MTNYHRVLVIAITLAALAYLSFAQRVYGTTLYVAPVYVAPVGIHPAFSTSTAEGIIRASARRFGASEAMLVATLKCESDFEADAVGDGGESLGIAQINLPSHPEISRTQALDPLWSIAWAAQEFAAGRAYEWSCFKATGARLGSPQQQ